eukprot:m.169862 g.169862  ORF g.169862 m.169862 type:complete len:340 (+) comp14512_c1_seq1:447-1466(+)
MSISTGDSQTQFVTNQPFDEVHTIDDAEEVASVLAASPAPSRGVDHGFSRRGLESSGRGNTPPESPDMDPEEYDGDVGAEEMESALHLTGREDILSPASDASETESSSEEDDDLGPRMEGSYDPADYVDLNVSSEVKDLFQFITSFEPEVHDLETKLQPFIPDYIPAVGDIDAFIKVPRPDGADMKLGLEVVDEPCAAQSDPTVLDLHLRTVAKTTTSRPLKLNQVKAGPEDTKAIDTWVTSITQVHRDQQPVNVHYTDNMPDMETLMQEWPPEMEALFAKMGAPSADLDVSLQQFTDIACAMLDIPVYGSRIQSLHMLFSLLAEFKNSQHFGGASAAQ